MFSFTRSRSRPKTGRLRNPGPQFLGDIHEQQKSLTQRCGIQYSMQRLSYRCVSRRGVRLRAVLASMEFSPLFSDSALF